MPIGFLDKCSHDLVVKSKFSHKLFLVQTKKQLIKQHRQSEWIINDSKIEYKRG